MTVSGHAGEGLERREADDCVKSCMLQCRGANAGTRRHYHWKRGYLDSLEASVGGNGDKYLGSNMSHTGERHVALGARYPKPWHVVPTQRFIQSIDLSDFSPWICCSHNALTVCLLSHGTFSDRSVH